MKPLIIKDIYVLARTMKLYLVLMICYAALGVSGNSFFYYFPIIFASVLPLTVYSYDEQSHFTGFSLTLPVTRRALVLSKYALGFFLTGSAAIIVILFHECFLLLPLEETPAFSLLGLLVISCVGLLAMDLNLPLILWLGAEKGRLFYIITICASAVIVSGSTVGVKPAGSFPPLAHGISSGVAAAIAVSFLLLATLVSVMVSLKIFDKKSF